MRALDRATMDEIGLPGLTLMEVAGRGVAATAIAMLDGARRGGVAIVCGPGNNGGDGFVVARVLRDAGLDAIAYLAAPRSAVKGDAKTHLEILERAGGVVLSIETAHELVEHREAIAGAELCVDALFGLGPLRPVEGHFAAIVETINRVRRRLAIDLPSGIDSDTGRTMGVAVDAHRTLSTGPLKVGLVGAPGFASCGEVSVIDIGIPRGVIATSNVRAGLVEESDITGWLPRARPLDHKGRRGHVLVVGGAPGMRGAGRLAALAALRSGAGLVTLAGEGDVTAADSIMTRALGDRLGSLLDDKHAIAIGPGLGASMTAQRHLAEVLASGKACILDADALNILAATPEAIAAAAGPVVITPHPGEAARLLDTTAAEVEADRMKAVRDLASKTRAVVVLKGARTLICDGTLGDDHVAINPTGGPALATAGSGDVLAGAIAALLAQGLPAIAAACTAVWMHGVAGDTLAARLGPRGVVSSDLPDAIAAAIAAATR